LKCRRRTANMLSASSACRVLLNVIFSAWQSKKVAEC
jgi:hypothetical protein